MSSCHHKNEGSIGFAEYLNEERPHAILLLVWNLFGRKTAVKCVMADVDEMGFVLNVSYGKSKQAESISYSFPHGPIKDSEKLKLSVCKLLARHSRASFPPGLAPWIVIALWVMMLIAAASEKDLQRYPYLSILQPYTLLIFRQPIYAVYSLLITIVGHTVEGMYVAFLCNKINIPKSSNVSWVALTLLIGYPTTRQVLQLSHVATKKPRNQ